MNKQTPFERYQNYIENLKKSGEKLATNQSGDLNFTVIAKQCKNRRQWFSENANKVMGSTKKTLAEIIRNDASAIGTSGRAPKNPESTLSDISEKVKKENNRLMRSLELKTAEIEKLRDQLAELEAKLEYLKQESKDRYQEMSENGRSFDHAEP